MCNVQKRNWLRVRLAALGDERFAFFLRLDRTEKSVLFQLYYWGGSFSLDFVVRFIWWVMSLWIRWLRNTRMRTRGDKFSDDATIFITVQDVERRARYRTSKLFFIFYRIDNTKRVFMRHWGVSTTSILAMSFIYILSEMSMTSSSSL